MEHLPPSAKILRDQIEAARNRALEKPQKAAEGTIERFIAHISALLANPEKFTSHDLFSEQMPADAYHDGSYYDYLHALGSKLLPLGYRVEKSYDGGGMFHTVVIRWDLEKTHRRN